MLTVPGQAPCKIKDFNKVYSTSVHDKDDKVFDFVQNVNNHRDTVLPWSLKVIF